MVERILQRGERYDFLVIDQSFGFGAMKGSDAIRALRAGLSGSTGPPLVIISCTGSHGDTFTNIIEAGANVVWTKPFPSWVDGTLQLQLKGLLDKRRLKYGEAPTDDATSIIVTK